MDYVRPIDKKRATLTFGLYPDITLAQARSLRANLKADLAVGVDPFVKRKAEEGEQRLQSSNTFAAIGEDYMSCHYTPVASTYFQISIRLFNQSQKIP